ncbi:MAG: hypothetical protein DRQ46_00240 [Gammaproteobacteria bacterium]|nr:MAG: hypothetical protein DRQ46_00240 [Gammaproteobacteria bacterium]
MPVIIAPIGYDIGGGSGTPSAPTMTIPSSNEAPTVEATLTGYDAGTVNNLYVKEDGGSWLTTPSAVFDNVTGKATVTLEAGVYWAYCKSINDSGSSIGTTDPILFEVTSDEQIENFYRVTAVEFLKGGLTKRLTLEKINKPITKTATDAVAEAAIIEASEQYTVSNFYRVTAVESVPGALTKTLLLEKIENPIT